MAVFRVQKTRDYTIMSNHHLRNSNLSLKAKGLLSLILSLPDEWNYTTRGLASICKEGVDSIGGALRELEGEGYIIRNRLRDKKGKITDTEYIIYECPQKLDTPSQDTPSQDTPSQDTPSQDTPSQDTPSQDTPSQDTPSQDTVSPCTDEPYTAQPHTENPYMDKQYTDEPYMGEPCQEKPAQLNTNKQIPKKINTDIYNTNPSIHQSINNQSTNAEPTQLNSNSTGRSVDRMDDAKIYRELIMENVEHKILIKRYGVQRMDEIVELMLETVLSKREYIRIAGDEYPSEVVKSRILKLSAYHIEYVLDSIDNTTTKIRNIKSYLLTALYNAPTTMNSYYRTEGNDEL